MQSPVSRVVCDLRQAVSAEFRERADVRAIAPRHWRTMFGKCANPTRKMMCPQATPTVTPSTYCGTEETLRRFPSSIDIGSLTAPETPNDGLQQPGPVGAKVHWPPLALSRGRASKARAELSKGLF